MLYVPGKLALYGITIRRLCTKDDLLLAKYYVLTTMDMVLNIKPANLNVPAHIILTRNTISFCVSRHIPHQTLLSNLCGHWTAHITLLTCFYCNLLRNHEVRNSYATDPLLIISFEITPSFLCALRTLQSNAL